MIKLEGKLLAPWIEEVSKAFPSGPEATSPISLDLSALTFVDAAGAKLLRDLITRGFEVVACSSYVAAFLRSSAEPRPPDSE